MRKAFAAFLILLVCGFVTGCSKSEEKAEAPPVEETETDTAALEPGGKVITSTDRISQITVIGGWDATKGLHKKAQLQASNPFKEMYLVVFTEKKDMYPGLTLDAYSLTTGKNLMKTLATARAQPAVQMKLDGNNAVQHEIRGTTSGNSKIVYLHTNVETPYYFHEILAWSPQSKFKQNRYALDGVIKTFKEVEAAPTAGGTAKP